MSAPTIERDRAALRRHYDVECELADRLRAAPPGERRGLYRTIYDELFTRVPDHPQNAWKRDDARQRARTDGQLRLLRHFLGAGSAYMEVGAGDCHLARTVAGRVRHAYAVDVSEVIAGAAERPANFSLIVSDGVAIPLPDGSIDVAYSHQLMEHLHPDDAAEQLGEIFRTLTPGGVYVCVTPHRLTGPHDISQYFDARARGFHLREYTYRELRDLFRGVGFAPTRPWYGLKGHFVELPEWAVLIAEAALGALPWRLRRWLGRTRLMRTVFGCLTIAGRKPHGPGPGRPGQGVA